MDKELIEHITAQLQNHEEIYPDGAWERFSKKENKRLRIAYWPIWAAAAIILIFGGVFLTLTNITPQNKIAIIKPKADHNPLTEGDTNTGTKEAPKPLNEHIISLNHPDVNDQAIVSHTVKPQPGPTKCGNAV